MPIPSPSDDEIIARERRRARLWNRTTLFSLLFWAAFALSLVLAFNLGVFQRLAAWAAVPNAVIIWFPMILLVFVWGAFLIYRRHFRPAPETMRPSVQNKLVDDYTRRQRWMLGIAVPLTIIMALNQPGAGAAHGIATWFDRATFAAYMLAVVLVLVLGPGFLNARYRRANDDELSRALRRRAAAVGIVVAMAAMAADYMISLAAPQWLTKAIPLSMAAVFVIPALYLLWADWQASRDV